VLPAIRVKTFLEKDELKKIFLKLIFIIINRFERLGVIFNWNNKGTVNIRNKSLVRVFNVDIIIG
jgi:hypothetical protein